MASNNGMEVCEDNKLQGYQFGMVEVECRTDITEYITFAIIHM